MAFTTAAMTNLLRILWPWWKLWLTKYQEVNNKELITNQGIGLVTDVSVCTPIGHIRSRLVLIPDESARTYVPTSAAKLLIATVGVR
jgi:hypothetical protein